MYLNRGKREGDRRNKPLILNKTHHRLATNLAGFEWYMETINQMSEYKAKFTEGPWEMRPISGSVFALKVGIINRDNTPRHTLSTTMHNVALMEQAPEMYDFIKCRFEALTDKSDLSIQEQGELIACRRILNDCNDV